MIHYPVRKPVKNPVGQKKKPGTYSSIECSVSSSEDQSFRLTKELIISLVTDKGCPKGEIAKKAYTSIFIQIFIMYNQM